MKAYPVLFSTEMVRAILSGQKTQTRRVVKLANAGYCDPQEGTYQDKHGETRSIFELCPYGQVGDLLWVRETWADNTPGCESQGGYSYRSDHLTGNDGPQEIKWKPSIFMPRAACRIKLKVVNVRIERLKSITPSDAIAEGVTFEQHGRGLGDACDEIRAVQAFESLWDKINAQRGYGWESNPWVWVVEFREVAPSAELDFSASLTDSPGIPHPLAEQFSA